MTSPDKVRECHRQLAGGWRPEGGRVSNPGDGQSLTDLMTTTTLDPHRPDTPPSLMIPLAHEAPPTAPVSSVLPATTPETPGYARLGEGGNGVRVDPVTVSALAADLSSIASAVGGADCAGISDSVSAGLPGSDTAWSCAAAEAALSSALDQLHSRFAAASDNVTTSLETYQATDAANADVIGQAGAR